MTRRNYQIHPFQVLGFLVMAALIALPAAADTTIPTSTGDASTGGFSTVYSTMMSTASSSMNNSTTNNATWAASLTCRSFHCMGLHCYQNESTYMNSDMNSTMNSTMYSTMNCSMGSYCELYRGNGSHYIAKCSNACALGKNTCMVNGTMKDLCTVDCCNTSMCLKLNRTAYFGEMQTTPAPTTTTKTTTTTTTAFPGNGKWCRTFSCDGVDCFKGKTALQQCKIGYDYCELKKKFSGSAVSFTAGCSNACKGASPSCTGATTGECYQECCNATTTTTCCLKLDGGVYLNGASQLNPGSLIKLLICAAIVILSSRLSDLQMI